MLPSLQAPKLSSRHTSTLQAVSCALQRSPPESVELPLCLDSQFRTAQLLVLQSTDAKKSKEAEKAAVKQAKEAEKEAAKAAKAAEKEAAKQAKDQAKAEKEAAKAAKAAEKDAAKQAKAAAAAAASKKRPAKGKRKGEGCLHIWRLPAV